MEGHMVILDGSKTMIEKIAPAFQEEIMCQALFFNLHIKTSEGKVWGEAKTGIFWRWSERGIIWIKHFWDSQRSQWLGIP
jgi:hypothetical protein